MRGRALRWQRVTQIERDLLLLLSAAGKPPLPPPLHALAENIHPLSCPSTCTLMLHVPYGSLCTAFRPRPLFSPIHPSTILTDSGHHDGGGAARTIRPLRQHRGAGAAEEEPQRRYVHTCCPHLTFTPACHTCHGMYIEGYCMHRGQVPSPPLPPRLCVLQPVRL